MKREAANLFSLSEAAVGVIALVGLYVISRYSYPAFHTIAELFGIIIGFSLFMLLWNSRRIIDNNYLVFIGIAYVSVAGLDLIHTLAYREINLFIGYGTNLPTQLWIAARYVESISLLTAPFFIHRKLKPGWTLASYIALTVVLLTSAFGGLFPDCYIDGIGLTPFKIISEYIISAILLCSLILLLRNRNEFDRDILVLLTLSIIITIGSELAFTFYVGFYDIPNLIGHYLKIISFYLIYKAIIEMGLSKPYNLMFRNLQQHEMALRESEERHRLLFEHSMDAILQMLPDGRILSANPTACRMFGCTEAELVQLGRDGIADSSDPRLGPAMEERARTGMFKGELTYMRKDKTKFPVDITSVSFRDEGGTVRSSIFIRDITERKLAADAVIHQAAKLEAMNQELESFAYSVSHDLRAPLRAIDGYSRMILSKQGDKFDDETKTRFNVIRHTTATMAKLIDDLLEFSRMGRKDLHITEIDMRQLLATTWEELQGLHPDRRMTLTMNELQPAWGDTALIKQVLINILSNAVKFTKGREEALIEVGNCIEENATVYYIRDNGVGFDMRYSDKLFKVFQRLHSADNFEGTGVGLSIVQRIIDRHGGRIWAESEVSKGATFYFTLPTRQE